MAREPKVRAAKASKKPRPLPESATAAEIAEILLLESPRWVQELVSKGYGERLARGRYNTLSMVQGYIRFLRDDKRDQTTASSANRKRDAQTRQLEIANARADHELGEITELSAILDEVTGGLRSEMMGLGAAVTRDLEMRRKIEDAVDERFARTAKGIKQKVAALAAGSPALDAGAEADT